MDPEAAMRAALAQAMRAALDQALHARDLGEVPIGAVIVHEGRIIGSGHNRTITDVDPSGHAELIALREAARSLGNHRLGGARLVTTLEPCLMCCGAALQARVEGLTYAADDPKTGAVALLRAAMESGKVNHRLSIERGPLAEESAELLRTFFQARRSSRRAADEPFSGRTP